MSQQSLKQSIKFGLAVAAAGFRIANHKSVPTDDGACWRATLVHEDTKIVTVSNGGHGGPDESAFHATTAAGKAEDKAQLVKLFAIPEVLAEMREHLMFDVDLDREYSGLSDADYDKRKAEIYSTTPEPTSDSVEFIVEKIAENAKFIASLQRAIKTKLVLTFAGDDAKCNFRSVKLADTPENRARMLKQEGGKIDYFVADLFGAIN